MQQLSTGNNAAKIKAEGTNTEADIVLGLETASFAQIAEHFAPLEGYGTSQYLEGINGADNRYYTWEKSGRRFYRKHAGTEGKRTGRAGNLRGSAEAGI